MDSIQILLSLSIALLAGLLLSRLAKAMKLPAVTAYLVAGILVGPFLLGRVSIFGTHLGFSEDDLEAFKIISEVALGFIAFSIGNEFRLSDLKKNGKAATVVGIFQAVVATLLVDAVLIIIAVTTNVISVPAAIVLGAIASATAPAATLMVVKQYKAKGPLTDILLPIVAIDDAVGLILFSVSFGIAKSIGTGAGISVISVLVNPLLEVVLSLLLGALMGFLFHLCERFFHSRSKRLAVSVTFVLLSVALSMMSFTIGEVHIAFSSLLVCMMLGTVFCNICDFSLELMDRVDRWTAPLFILFFVISGAELDLTVFMSIGIVLVGVAYILARSAGKYLGAFASSKAMKCDDKIVKYLGITLLPQAGVALGMAIKASDETNGLGKDGAIVAQITLFAVLIYELFGPLLTKISLTKAGEIVPEGQVSARDEARKILEMLHLSGRHGRHSEHVDRNVTLGGVNKSEKTDAKSDDNNQTENK
ncbi:MAG: cation:proton antiporter [Clostridia bacterium]|nr:cation:proton antiporter [Clostridia bacterium]